MKDSRMKLGGRSLADCKVLQIQSLLHRKNKQRKLNKGHLSPSRLTIKECLKKVCKEKGNDKLVWNTRKKAIPTVMVAVDKWMFLIFPLYLTMKPQISVLTCLSM